MGDYEGKLDIVRVPVFIRSSLEGGLRGPLSSQRADRPGCRFHAGPDEDEVPGGVGHRGVSPYVSRAGREVDTVITDTGQRRSTTGWYTTDKRQQTILRNSTSILRPTVTPAVGLVSIGKTKLAANSRDSGEGWPRLSVWSLSLTVPGLRLCR